MKTVYLAGPIVGRTKAEANDWRNEVSAELAVFGVRGISPLRCEELPGKTYNTGAVDPLFGSDEAVATKNLFDVMECDLTLAYIPGTFEADRPAYGTVCEIAWAKLLRKPVILCSTSLRVMNHPVIKACAGWRVDNLRDAITICKGLFQDYP